MDRIEIDNPDGTYFDNDIEPLARGRKNNMTGTRGAAARQLNGYDDAFAKKPPNADLYRLDALVNDSPINAITIRIGFRAVTKIEALCVGGVQTQWVHERASKKVKS